MSSTENAAAGGEPLLDNSHKITSNPYRYGLPIDANCRVKYFGDTAKIATFSRDLFRVEHSERVHRDKYTTREAAIWLKRWNMLHPPTDKYEQLSFDGLERLAAKESERRRRYAEYLATPRPPRKDSRKRARDKLFEIAYANEWEWFVTLTLDPQRIDREDVAAITKAARGWLSNFVQRDGGAYLAVLEYHRDHRGIHIHALARGALHAVDSGTVSVEGKKKPIKRSTADRQGIPASERHAVYNVDNWALGWSTAIKVYGEQGSVAGYLAKYITKAEEKIAGKWYWSGGELAREVPTVYHYTDYTTAAGKEVAAPADVLRVKYLTVERADIEPLARLNAQAGDQAYSVNKALRQIGGRF